MADFDQEARKAWIRFAVGLAAGSADDEHPLRVLARAMAEDRGLCISPVDRFMDGARAERTRKSRDPDDHGVIPDLRPPRDPRFLAEAHEALIGAGAVDRFARKRSNTFTTPPALADLMVRALLETDRPRRVLDPACGAGSLLVSLLRAAGPAARRVHADPGVEYLGLDVDPVAVALCRIAVWLELSDQNVDPASALDFAERNILRSDGLQDDHGTFDGILANPPWDQLRWDDAAFFLAHDPEHRRRPRREADRIRRDLMADDAALRDAYGRARRKHDDLVARRRQALPLSCRTGVPNLAPMFVETSLQRLADGGVAVFLVPSGLHTDLGCQPLRARLLDDEDTDLWVGFENRKRVFPRVDGRFRFDLVRTRTIRRDGRRPRRTLRCGFLNRTPSDFDDLARVRIDPQNIRLASPRSLALPEFRTQGEADLFFALTARNHRLHDLPRILVEVRREFDLTVDRAHFTHREQFLDRGRPSTLLPLLEGRHVDAFRPFSKTYVQGSGRRALWRDVPLTVARGEAQYYVDEALARERDPWFEVPKVGLMAIASATNTRTSIASPIHRVPCGNSVLTLRCRERIDSGSTAQAGNARAETLVLAAILNSLVFDWWIRRRLGGLNLNRFLLEETVLPDLRTLSEAPAFIELIARLTWPFVADHDALVAVGLPRSDSPDLLRIDRRTEARALLDALIAKSYGCDTKELSQILDEDPGDPRGFFRIDRDRPPGRRLPELVRRTFERLPRTTEVDAVQTACEEFLTGC